MIDRANKVIGFTCGSFDLLHAGHALMLEEAKSHCDWLIVGLQTDPSIDRKSKNKPVMSLEERHTMIRSIRWVDEVRVYETEADLLELLKEIQPDVRVVGADWQGKAFTGHELPIRVVFNSRLHTYSTTSLRLRVYEAERKKLYDEDSAVRESWSNAVIKSTDRKKNLEP